MILYDFCLFLVSLYQSFQLNDAIKKVICTIFNVNLFNTSHLYYYIVV